MANQIDEIRNLFNTAHASQEDCQSLLDLTALSSDSLHKAYHAAATMVSSKFIVNPFKIGAVFRTGKNDLEDLISEHFDDVEMHFLRYTIQLNTPKFIGYHRNIDADRTILRDYLKSNPDSELSKHMMVFIQNTNDQLLSA